MSYTYRYMEKQTLLELIDKGLTVQKIADHENCSFTNVRYWLRKYGLNTKTYDNAGKKCRACQASLKGRQTEFCSHKCKTKTLWKGKYQTNRDEILSRVRQKGLERKIYFVNKLGGKCQCCGYDKNLAALTFHHVNPENKSFNLDVRKMTNTRMTSLEEEFKKCKLLCQNCHTELHNTKHNNWK